MGQWREAGWPGKEKNQVNRSMERSWIARKREKSGNPVNEEELDGPRKGKIR
ncbi:hypothetical protein [Neobacillus mesonae]|uniref:hypothetical protein n=1 Tax=Neobacillus mesonae TaxID=1193713 RepID=UPI00203AC739|nr:hypothetical protein [Neobacillus mesonae]MCM3566471.1 hypothetical protein [Neobacillus mesonae]